MKHARTAPQWAREGGLEAEIAAKRSAAKFRAKAVSLTKQFSPIPLIVFLLFALSRPYAGIVQDAYIYMGRALADLDPNGIGRDLMFVHDGQFGFSLFRSAAKAMVWCLGLATAAKALAILAAFAWFFGMCAFARQYANGAGVWVTAVFAALLPNAYGAPYPFGFAELSAIPRPFAEALVLAALAALAARRDSVAIVFMAAAVLVHPIMAMAGLAVLALVLSMEDKRWFWLCALAGAVLILAGATGVPFVNRLFVVIDPSLKSLHEQRSSFLFPSLWPAESFPSLIVQAAAIVIAAHLQRGRRRRILAAIILAGVGGIAATAIFGDWLSSLLILQAQPWRMAWLMAAVGAMSLGICAVDLWRHGQGERIVLALLFLCWSFNSQWLVAAPAAILALVLYFRAERYPALLNEKLVAYVWIFAIAVATIWHVRLLAYPWNFYIATPVGYGNFELVLVKGVLAIPLCALAVYFAIARPRISPLLQRGAAALLFAATLAFWDHRPPAQRDAEENRFPPRLTQQIAQHPGEVIWIDGLAEPWFVLGRPQWASPLQGAPIIFSDLLATEWRRRMQILMDLRLADQKSFSPWADPESADVPRLSQDGVRRLCAREDAPAWIIVPVEHGKGAGIDMTVWPLPNPHYLMTKLDGDYGWRRIDAYGVIACAKQSA